MNTFTNPFSTGLLRVGKSLYVSVFTVIAICAAVVCDVSVCTFYVLLSIILHECGHVIALRLCGVTPSCLYVYPFGLDMRADTSKLSYLGEAAVMGAGIAANSILFLLSFAAGRYIHSQTLMFFAFANAFFAVTNAIPSGGLDGGRILMCLLCERLSPDVAQKICRMASAVSYALICVLGVGLFYFTDCNLSVVILSCYVVLSAVVAEKLVG